MRARRHNHTKTMSETTKHTEHLDDLIERFESGYIANHAKSADVMRAKHEKFLRENRNLFAAAPDLLAALQACADKLAMWPEGSNPEFFPCLKAARAALAKAAQ